MKFSLLFVLWFSSAALGQVAIPVGTVLPVQLNHSLNAGKSKPGQSITARIMQDVPLPSGSRIRAGSEVQGSILSVTASKGGESQVSLRFDTLKTRHESISISVSLRALASMMEVADAQIPPSGPDRGTPWAWTTRYLIGGEIAYGEGGPVVRETETVGRTLFDGVLVRLNPNPKAGCGGELAGSTQPQALWIFSSDACGVYGIDNLRIAHAGRTLPVGDIILATTTGNLLVRGGAGLLLRVTGSPSRSYKRQAISDKPGGSSW